MCFRIATVLVKHTTAGTVLVRIIDQSTHPPFTTLKRSFPYSVSHFLYYTFFKSCVCVCVCVCVCEGGVEGEGEKEEEEEEEAEETAYL